VNGDDIDAFVAHGVQHRLQLVLQHCKVTVDDGCVIGASKGGPSRDADLLGYLVPCILAERPMTTLTMP
jgi:hypothetical protein